MRKKQEAEGIRRALDTNDIIEINRAKVATVERLSAEPPLPPKEPKGMNYMSDSTKLELGAALAWGVSAIGSVYSLLSQRHRNQMKEDLNNVHLEPIPSFKEPTDWADPNANSE